jgi:hypothetical protein
MKKIFLGISILLIILSSCKKEVEVTQIELTLKNLTTLLGKSTDYIKDASPGIFDEAGDDYLAFNIINSLEVIETGFIFYNITDKKCDMIIIGSNDMNNIDEAKDLMNLSENEFGDGSYFLSYNDSIEVLHDKNFNTYNELWEFVNTNKIVVGDITEISSLHSYNDYYFISGGAYMQEAASFMPIIQIGYIKDLFKKSARSGQYMKFKTPT